MKHFRVYWQTCVLALFALLLAAAAGATTIVLPTDEQLIAKSPLIVEGTVASTQPVDRGSAIWTETVIQVDRVLKGNAGATVTVRELGGVIGERITKIFGAPAYTAGEHVLVFLTPTPRGDYQTTDLFVGKFGREAMSSGGHVWMRRDDTADATLLDASMRPVHTHNVQRETAGFEQFVSDRVAGRAGTKNYLIENPVLQRDLAPSADATSTSGRFGISDNFTLISEPQVYRWFAFDRGSSVNWYSLGAQPGYTGNGVTEVQTAMNAWNGYSAAKIRYNYAGSRNGSSPGLQAQNGVNEVLFNDPNQEIAGSWNPSTGGVVGLGGFNGVTSGGNWAAPFTADASHVQQTYRAIEITEANLTVQDGVSPTARISSTTLAEIVAHEFGHTLGFGHSADSSALMYYSVTGLGPSLRADDQVAARWLYPSGTGGTPTPTPTPTVPAAPTGLSATPSGTNVSLSWIDNATNETGQGIYVAIGNGSFGKVADAGAGVRNATLSGFAAGTYRIYVTAYNAAGESGASNVATVTISAPSTVAASFNVSPSTGVAGQTSFVFSDTSTGSITSRQWNFGDGQSTSVAAPSHVYAATGTYTVILTVSGSSNTSQATRTITVTAPAATLTAGFRFTPSNPTTDQTVAFTDASTGPITNWSWAFGDGTTGNTPSPTHRYTQAGTYRVTLTVFGTGGTTATTSQTLTVSAPIPATPPVSAAFDVTPSSPTVGTEAHFVDQSSGSPTSWRWNFGDGNSSTSQNVWHGYVAPGTYTVTLTVSNAGSSQTTSRQITVVNALVPFRSLISAAAQTNGVGGTVWRTELTLFNAGSESANVSLIYIPGAGGAVQTRTLFLQPRQSTTYNNALLDIFGISAGAGAIAVEANSPTTSANLRVASRTFTTGSTGTYGQAVPDVGAADLPQSVYLTGLEADADYRTNIGFVNKSDRSVSVSLAMLDANGNAFPSTGLTLAPNSFQQTPLTLLFPTLGSKPQGGLSVIVGTGAPDAVSVYASIIDNRSQDPIYIRGTALPSGNELVIPAVGRTAGANGTFWRSDVTLFNSAATSLNVTLRYLAAGADNRAAVAKTVTIGSNRTVVLSDVLQSQFGLASGAGALRISWSGTRGPIVGSRTYTAGAGGGTYGQSVDPTSSWSSDVFVTGVRSDSSFRTNLGFVNGGDATIGVNVTLISQYGQPLATGFVQLAPRSYSQTAATTLFPGVDVAHLGPFTVQAHTDAGATLFAYGSVVDNSSGDPVFFAGK